MTLVGAEDNSVTNVFPVGMHNSGLVLKDEDGNSVTELEEWSGASDQTVVPAAINIENSTDVIIGPVTQFNGPVTIYQNVNGQPTTANQIENGSVNNSVNGKSIKSTAAESLLAPDETGKISVFFSKYVNVKYLGILLTLLLVLVIIGFVILYYQPTSPKPSNNDGDDQPTSPPPKPSNSGGDDDVTVAPRGPGAIIDKAQWGGQPTLNFAKPLQHPTPFVIVSHTVTPVCTNFVECSQRVRSIQEYHVGKLHSPDVGYNFLVGGDGNAYVGRGWDIRNFHSPNSIGISFIGNYIYDHLTPEMIRVTKELLEEGVKKGKLAEDYKLVCHNQTYNTESPGGNVYDVVKTWPHYDSGLYL
ncbi:peptidoglycan-recognition protein LA-like isoform X1 [Tenebrio molitor]|jgi:hypothetical protein|uniref:peptidoglycan-recognition protein LA-like isoform X1 n=1 Tax=Tenebrio molitor TaxID=7067 RepID=UPI00362495CA